MTKVEDMVKSAAQPSIKPIRLRFNDDTPVVVVPQDEDRFMTTASDAAFACQQAQNMLRWKHEFDRFLARIHTWCNEKNKFVSRSYVAFSSEGLNVFVLTKGADYRFDIDDDVAKLDINLAKEFPQCPAEVSHFPEVPVESLSSFFHSAKALQVYGD